MKKSVFISQFFVSLLLVFSISAMEPESYQYGLSVAKIDPDSFKVKISKSNRIAKQSCSFIANFGTHTCDDQKDMFAPFDAAAVNFDQETSAFFWDVSDFGLLKLLPDGSTFLGHHSDDTSLLHDSLTIETPAKLFLETLHVDALNIKSKETQLCNAVVAKKISANHRVCNRGGLQIKELTGRGIFINEGRVEFKGAQEDPALLGIRLFQNRNSKHCTPTVHAAHLSIDGSNKKIVNGKDAFFKVDGFMMERLTAPDALFHNKGVCRIDVGNLQRKIINEGLLQANALSTRKTLENKEFAHLKIFDKASIENLDNEGQMDASRSLEMNFCTNKGTIDGSLDLAFRVRSVMQNYGQIRLRDLLGINEYNGHAVLYNYKELLFHDNGSIDGGYLINGGLVKGLGMRLSKTLIDNKKGARFALAKSTIDETRKITNEGDFRVQTCKLKEPLVNLGIGVFEIDELEVNQIHNRGILKTGSLHLHESLKNEQKGVVEVDKRSVVENAVIDNAADIKLHGDIAFKTAQVTNKGKMICESGEISSADSQLHNEGDWLFRDVTSATSLDMTNKGILECVDSSLHFGNLQNDNDLILHSGTYTVDTFKNKKLQLLDNHWAITDDPARRTNKLVLLNPKKGVLKDPDLGEIQCEKDLLYELPAMPNALRTQADINCSSKFLYNIGLLKEII